MAYVMFAIVQGLGLIILYLTKQQVFSLTFAFMVILVMLALSFHVMVRKPDSVSIRMACFTAVLWFAAIFCGNLFFEFRGPVISSAALLVGLLAAATAGASTVSLIERPAELDVES